MKKVVSSLPVTISPNFALGLGSAVYAWGRLEFDLELYLHFLRECPAARTIEAEVPASFAKRANLLKKSAAVCFQRVDSLPEKISKVVNRAVELGVQRNRLMHGSIMDDSFLKDDGDLHIYIREKRQLNAYSASLAEVHQLVKDIVQVHQELLLIFAGWGVLGSGNLNALEREALQIFRREFLQEHSVQLGVKVSGPRPTFRR